METVLVNVHPAIRGLLMLLPPPGSTWSREQQEAWLSAVRNIFGLIYQPSYEDIEASQPKAEVTDG